MATITFNQTGLPAGLADRARSDGRAGRTITITTSEPGALELLWAPTQDIAAQASFAQVNETTWTAEAAPNVFGTYLFRFTPASGGPAVRRGFAIRSPKRSLRVPALNESASPIASLVSANADAVALSDFNEAEGGASSRFGQGDYGGWYSSLVELYETVETIGSLGFAAEAVSGSDIELTASNLIYRVEANEGQPTNIELPANPSASDRVGILLVATVQVRVTANTGQHVRDPQLVGQAPYAELNYEGDYILFIWDATSSVWRVESWTSPTQLIDPTPDPFGEDGEGGTPGSGGGGNGGGGTSGVATGLKTSTTVVDVSGSGPPQHGQVLYAIDGTSAVWAFPDIPTVADPGPATELKVVGTDAKVNVGNSPAPTAGQVLTALSSSNARWKDPTAAKAIAIDGGGSIDVEADAPVAGQVLTAVDGTHASWANVPAFVDPPAARLKTNVGSVLLSGTPPSPGQVLTAQDGQNAAWITPENDNSGGGGDGGPAYELQTGAGPTVVIGDSPQPFPGYVLTADSQEHATWQEPSYVARQLVMGDGSSVAVDGGAPPEPGWILTANDQYNASFQPPPTSGGGSRTGNPYIDAPLDPDPANDEFDSGSPDLAERGFTVWDVVGHAVLSRVGDVNFWADPGLALTEYRSSIIGSKLFIQYPADRTYVVFKQIDGDPSGVYAVRIGSYLRFQNNNSDGAGDRYLYGGTNDTPFFNGGQAISTGAFLHSGRWRLITYVNNVDRIVMDIAKDDTAWAILPYDLYVANYDGSLAQPRWIDASSGAQVLASNLGGTSTYNYWGFQMNALVGMTPKLRVFEIDYFRKLPANGWFG